MSVASWDLNKDETVTCDEWNGYVSMIISEVDADRNQSISAVEFASIAKTDRMFVVADLSFFDADKNGSLSHVEMTAKENPAFRILDENRDCQLVATEIARAGSLHIPPPDRPPPGPVGPGAGGQPGAGATGGGR